jgi:hypothetical protein
VYRGEFERRQHASIRKFNEDRYVNSGAIRISFLELKLFIKNQGKTEIKRLNKGFLLV